MDKKLKYSELEAENAALKVENADTRKALADALLLFETVNELYQGQVKLVAFMAKEVDDFELLKL
jgi:hypothetical protein